MDEPIYEIISNPTYHGKAGIPIYNGDMLVGYQYIKQNGGLLYYLYQGVKLGIFPPLIFMGVGAMTDFGPLIADPKSLLVVVDTNRPDQVECKPLLESISRVAVIDHHRRAADYIDMAESDRVKAARADRSSHQRLSFIYTVSFTLP